MKRRVLALPFLMAGMLWAHPMGNFSVSHYSRIEVDGHGASIRYVLDLAEIPTFELLQGWKADAATPQAELDRRASEQAREWARHLKVSVDGRPAPVTLAARQGSAGQRRGWYADCAGDCRFARGGAAR